MNKKVYLCDLKWTKLLKGHNIDGTPDFLGKGGLKATIVFNDIIPYDEVEKIRDNNYFYLTNEDYKSRIDKAIELLEREKRFERLFGGVDGKSFAEQTIDVLKGE